MSYRFGSSRLGWHANRTKDDGASLVEFAVAMPLLLLLVLGIIEFGFVLAQMNEIRHGAREGARYAAVSRPDVNNDGTTGNNADVVQVVCDAVNLPGLTVEISLSHTESNGTSGAQRLEYGLVTVEADTEPLTGFPLLTAILPDQLSNEATFRLEQDAAWSTVSGQGC